MGNDVSELMQRCKQILGEKFDRVLKATRKEHPILPTRGILNTIVQQHSVKVIGKETVFGLFIHGVPTANDGQQFFVIDEHMNIVQINIRTPVRVLPKAFEAIKLKIRHNRNLIGNFDFMDSDGRWKRTKKVSRSLLENHSVFTQPETIEKSNFGRPVLLVGVITSVFGQNWVEGKQLDAPLHPITEDGKVALRLRVVAPEHRNVPFNTILPSQVCTINISTTDALKAVFGSDVPEAWDEFIHYILNLSAEDAITNLRNCLDGSTRVFFGRANRKKPDGTDSRNPYIAITSPPLIVEPEKIGLTLKTEDVSETLPSTESPHAMSKNAKTVLEVINGSSLPHMSYDNFRASASKKGVPPDKFDEALNTLIDSGKVEEIGGGTFVSSERKEKKRKKKK